MMYACNAQTLMHYLILILYNNINMHYLLLLFNSHWTSMTLYICDLCILKQFLLITLILWIDTKILYYASASCYYWSTEMILFWTYYSDVSYILFQFKILPWFSCKVGWWFIIFLPWWLSPSWTETVTTDKSNKKCQSWHHNQYTCHRYQCCSQYLSSSSSSSAGIGCSYVLKGQWVYKNT